MLEQHGGNVELVPERVSKIELKLYQVYIVFSLMRVKNNVVFAEGAFSESRGK